MLYLPGKKHIKEKKERFPEIKGVTIVQKILSHNSENLLIPKIPVQTIIKEEDLQKLPVGEIL